MAVSGQVIVIYMPQTYYETKKDTVVFNKVIVISMDISIMNGCAQRCHSGTHQILNPQSPNYMGATLATLRTSFIDVISHANFHFTKILTNPHYNIKISC